MLLVLPIPSDWHTEHRDGVLHAHVPGHTAEPDLIITVSPIKALPPAVDAAWIHHQLSGDLPHGASLKIQQSVEDKGTHGWPATRLRSAVVAADGTLLQQRISVIFRLLDGFAVAELRGMDPVRWNTHSGELGVIVMGAELDWSAEPCCLAQLYGLGPDHPVFVGDSSTATAH